MQDISLNKKSASENRHYIKSSSFVMAMLFTILCGLAALSLGYFIHFFAKGHFIHNTEAVLDAEIRYIEAVGPTTLKSDNRLYLFLNPDGSVPGISSKDLSRLTEGILVFRYSKNNRRYAAKIHTLDDNRKILIGSDITQISKDFKFMQWLGIASVCFVMAVVFVAYIISVFVVSGTNKIADTAREIISTGDLSRRLEVGSRWDDLGNMAAVLNVLLERIEELMRGVRQVSDNIAHDLRTPLTRMRGHIEELKDDEAKDALMAEADHLLDTFNALLRISRIEAERQRSQFKDVNLQKLLEDVIAFYEPLAEEKSISLNASLMEARIHGDSNLLFQAFANLLDNALKFTPSGGRVSIDVHKDNRQIKIVITDTGSGVSEDEKDKIFNRFFRSEKARSSAGTGLGLSLVNAVILLHGGHINVENNNPGLSMIIMLKNS